MYRGRRRQGPGFALMLLFMQMARVGFDHIPPVTLGTILAQVAIYLKPLAIRWPSLDKVCISTVTVWYREEWHRLFTAAFFHGSEWHLYYNMISFLWKGMSLERRLGSRYMLTLIAVFALLSNTLTVWLGHFAERTLHDPSYLSACGVGFSGVLFALKVVTTSLMPSGRQMILGFFPVHARYACWVELFVIQLLVPNASFAGHLAGILIGMAYVHGPLRYIIDMFIKPDGSGQQRANTSGQQDSFFSGLFRPWRAGRFGGSGQPRHPGDARRPGWMDSRQPRADQMNVDDGEDEQMAEAMRRSLRDHHESMRPARSPTAPTAPRPTEPSAPPQPEPTAPPAYGQVDGDNPPPYPDVPPPPYPGTQQPHTNGPPQPHANGQFTVPQGAPTLPSRGNAGRLYPDLSPEAQSGGYAPQAQTGGDRPQNQSGGPMLQNQSGGPAPRYGWNVDQDEMRRRRLARFDSH